MFASRLQILDRAKTWAFPPDCLRCGDRVEIPYGLCGPCWAEAQFIGKSCCHACGDELIGEEAAPSDLCDACLMRPPPWDAGRAVLRYEGTGRALVLALKHGDRADICRAASSWMAEKAQEWLGQNPLLVPIPLHPLRLLQRRFNQSALLAHHICRTPQFREHAITCLPDALYRLRRTAPQDGLGAEARFANLDEALALTPRHSERLRGRAVILIDDVMTSGATLWSATHALRLGGAGPIYVLVMARATKAA